MNKIFNWTFGSIFRTIGRIIAYIIIGALLFYIAESNDFHFPSWLFMKVDALSLDGTLTSNDKVFTSPYHINYIVGEDSVENANFNYWVNTGDNDYVTFGMQGYLVVQNDIDNDATYNFTVSQFIPYINVTLKTTGAWEGCEIQGNTIVCPVPKNKQITGLQFNIDTGDSFNNDITIQLNFYIPEYANFYKKDINGITGAIDSQTQQQQQQHEETMNSSTEDAENEAEGFFDDFDVPDTGGLSAIITAPLNTINSLLSNSCSNLVLPLPFVNKNLSLPCLYSIYNQYFGAFFTLYQTIILAIVSYRCIRSIYFDITGFMNPDDDRIEVMDL